VIARERGVDVEEVERVLSTYWGRPGAKERSGVSPVEERVQVLSEFWNAFDELHGLQAPRMPSLWGLVEEFRSIHIGPQGPDWYNPQLYRKLLPEALQHRIEELWGR